MNAEDFVTYQQAVALKKLGLREKCYHYYDSSRILQPNDFICNQVFQMVISSQLLGSHNSGIPKETFDAPTLSQAQKWLRKKKGLSVEPRSWSKNYKFYIVQIETCRDIVFSHNSYSSYEEALSTGITECLKLLEKNER